MTTPRFFIALALAGAAHVVQAMPPDARKDSAPRMKFDCASFEHLDDGNWKGRAQATATLERSKFDFSGTVFRPGEVVIDGIDMKSRLDAQCLHKDERRR